MHRSGFIWIMALAMVSGFSQNIIYNSTPEWTSQAAGHYATGLGVADINRDGWPDIIVANGNDMQRQRLVVYYNNGFGGFPIVPSWSSGDIDYNGHLAVGDINGDGLPDVAVSVFLGPGRFSDPGYVKVYYNQAGQLQSLPGWRSADSMYTFSCALGDADGDGDLDLAVACGEPYHSITDRGRIYYNQNGVLDSLPGWQSQVVMGAMDVDFADMDNNGFLDLIFACHLTPNYIFLADANGQIPANPSWQSQDNSYYANSLTIACIDDNDFPDLVISDNSQLGGQGKYKAYFFNQPPSGQSIPGWYSTSGGYGSAVLAADVDRNGRPDLIAGRWWGRVEIYHDYLGSFTVTPGWWSATNSVIEAYVLSDMNRDDQSMFQFSRVVTTDSIRVIDIRDTRLEEIAAVRVNQQNLTAGLDFCTVSGATWLSFRNPLLSGDVVEVDYVGSNKKDLLVSNWDPTVGNYLFYHQGQPTALASGPTVPLTTSLQIFPNPFNQQCQFTFTLSRKSPVHLTIYDPLGRPVKKIAGEEFEAGTHRLFWNGVTESQGVAGSGLYLFHFQYGTESQTGKIILLK